MLITITRATDHPADYILAAADDPTEWVRVTPSDLPALALALPDGLLDDEDVELVRMGDKSVARAGINLALTGSVGQQIAGPTEATIDYHDWHRLRMGGRPAGFSVLGWQAMENWLQATTNEQGEKHP